MEKRVSLSRKPPVDVLIVGGGLSGLTTAWKLLQKEPSLSIRILEASHQLGGKLCETDLGEIGGKWITIEQRHICDLLRTLRIPMHRVTEESERQQQVPDVRKLKRCWDIDDGSMAVLAKFELHRYIRHLDLNMSFFQERNYCYGQHMETMYRHIQKSLLFEASRQFMQNLVLLVSGVHSSDINYEEFMVICASCGGLGQLIDIYLKGPSSSNLLEFSSLDLISALKRSLHHIEIQKEHRVVELRAQKKYIEVFDSMLTMHRATVVVLAIPWSSIQQIYYRSPQSISSEPPLQTLLKQTDYCITSFLIKYSLSYWRLAGYSGQLMCHDPFLLGYEYRPTVYCCHVILGRRTLDQILVNANCHMECWIVRKLAEYFGDYMLKPLKMTGQTYELSYLPRSSISGANGAAAVACCIRGCAGKRIIWSSSSVAATCFRGCISGAVQSGMHAAMRALLVVRPQLVTARDHQELYCSSCTNRNASWMKLWESTLNLYNVSYYGVIIGGIYACWQAYKS